MARMRTIKPEFWTDKRIVSLSAFARLLYIGTWNFACDAGHLVDDADELHMKVLPRDDVDVEALLKEVIDTGRIQVRRTPSGREYLHLPKLTDHQKIDARWVSRCPICTELRSFGDPEASPGLPEPRGSLGELPETPQASAGMGGDGTGGEGMGGGGRSKRATALPPDFDVTEQMRDWAIEKGYSRSLTLNQTERFRNWAEATGKTYKDWPAAWRNWLGREVPDALPITSNRIEGM